jgi:hypothetical protein
MKEIKTELYEQFEKESASASDKTFLNKLFKETKAEVSRPKKDRVKVEITQNRYPKPLVMTYEYHSTQFERMNLFVFKEDCYQEWLFHGFIFVKEDFYDFFYEVVAAVNEAYGDIVVYRHIA